MEFCIAGGPRVIQLTASFSIALGTTPERIAPLVLNHFDQVQPMVTDERVAPRIGRPTHLLLQDILLSLN